MLEIKRINLPKENVENSYCTYQNQLQPRKRFADSELEALYNANEADILKIVENGICDYVNDDNLCNDDKGFFPRRCELTGEWYVNGIYFEERECLIIGTAFLGVYGDGKDDYLGLDVFMHYDDELNKFVFDGDINSSVI